MDLNCNATAKIQQGDGAKLSKHTCQNMVAEPTNDN